MNEEYQGGATQQTPMIMKSEYTVAKSTEHGGSQWGAGATNPTGAFSEYNQTQPM
jgi:hypothetical protein